MVSCFVLRKTTENIDEFWLRSLLACVHWAVNNTSCVHSRHQHVQIVYTCTTRRQFLDNYSCRYRVQEQDYYSLSLSEASGTRMTCALLFISLFTHQTSANCMSTSGYLLTVALRTFQPHPSSVINKYLDRGLANNEHRKPCLLLEEDSQWTMSTGEPV